jgi:hypothetical protein
LLWALAGGALLLLGIGGAALARRRRPLAAEADATHDFAAPPARPGLAERAEPPHRTVSATADADSPRSLAAMVAAAPDAENPFRTRAKRLRRAKYLIAQREAAAATHRPAPQTTHAEPALVAAVDRSQTVYRFGSSGTPSGYLKPRTR